MSDRRTADGFEGVDADARLRLVVGAARDYAIFTTDRDGRVVDWYPGAEVVFGYSADEARGMDAAVLFTPEDRAAGVHREELAEAAESGAAPNERWHLRRDGGRVFIEGRNFALRDAAGALTGFLKIGQDVTERRRTDQALRESEERFRQFGEHAADTLWIVDAATGELEYLSPAFERTWGEARDRVMGDLRRWRDFVHPDDRAEAEKGLPRLLAGERVAAEYRIIRADGRIRWIRDLGFPIRGPEGRVVRVAGIAHDFTEAREREEALSESERRFRTLTEGVPQLVWRAAADGRWTWASPRWPAATGRSEGDSLGWGWLDALHPDDRDAARAAWEGAAGRGTYEADHRVRGEGGSPYRWFQSRALPVRDAAGRVVEWLGASTDVDDLRRLEEHGRLLLAELQHRVRNSLAVVRSIARRTGEASETVEDFAAHLDGRLGAFARTQAAVTRDPARGLDLRLLIEDELAALAAREGPKVRVDGPDVRLRPKAAETLALAVHELATNSVKYGALSNGGVLSVDWRLEDSALVLDWRERFDVRPADPGRRGFGTELLEQTLPYELDARVARDLRADALTCTIRVPVARALA